MQRRTRSILDELAHMPVSKDRENLVESRASHVIQGAINLINYIKTYKTIPTVQSKNKNVRGLCVWMNAQYNNYHKNHSAMKDPELRILWDKFLVDHNDVIYFS